MTDEWLLSSGDVVRFTSTLCKNDPANAEINQHHAASVTVVRRATDAEALADEVGPMYLVRGRNGHEFHAFQEELVD